MEVDPGVSFLHVGMVGLAVMSMLTFTSCVCYCRLPKQEVEKKDKKKKKKIS